HSGQTSASVDLIGDLGVQADPGGEEKWIVVGQPEIEGTRLPAEEQACGSGGIAGNAEGAAEVVPGAGGDDPQRGAGAGEPRSDVADAAVTSHRGDPIEPFLGGPCGQLPCFPCRPG